MRLVLAALLCVGLAACQRTGFESLPVADAAVCDTRWEGQWRIDMPDEDDDPDDTIYVDIGTGCSTVTFVENGKRTDEPMIEVHFARVAQIEIVTMRAIDGTDAVPSEAVRRMGFMYFRQEARRDRIMLHPVDDRRVANWLIQGDLEGTVDFASRHAGGRRPRHGNTLENFVAGDTEAMASIVTRRGLFERRPSIILTRVDGLPASEPDETTENPP